MMNVIFKFEVLKSILKLYFQRKAFERNPKKHQQRMWRKFQSGGIKEKILAASDK